MSVGHIQFVECIHPWPFCEKQHHVVALGVEKFICGLDLGQGESPCFMVLDLFVHLVLLWLAMDIDLLTDAESSGGEIDANWSAEDQKLFGPEWVEAMNHLESTPLDILMAEVSFDGFVPTSWQEAQAAISSTLLQHGFVGQRLLVQRGEEKELLAQVLTEMGWELDTKQQEYHRRRLVQLILELEYAEPFAKRLRGEQLPPSVQYIQDACHKLSLIHI